MFTKVLIANRGEIAVRIAKTLKKMGIGSVAVYSEADKHSLHVSVADEAFLLGGSNPNESYLCGDKIIALAQQCGAQAIIPGYGFLSENAAFAEACAAAGLVFVGPTPAQMRQFGLKHASRELAEHAGVPLAKGTGLLSSLAEALHAAEQLGYPVMLKSTAGGGGIGLSRCYNADELSTAFDSVQRLGKNFFNDGGVFLERFIDQARHVEVQIFGNGLGDVVALGERDCSVQRRNQKVIEETPAPNLPAATREALLAAAVSLGKAVAYQSAGTVEFIYDSQRDEFYFLEVNTRLQVEHPITECVTGIDLVEWMILTAAGEPPSFASLPTPVGAAIEVRIYAEDPLKNFQPSPGTLTEVVFPAEARIDGWVATGTEVSPYYDPMLAKVIVTGTDRADAIAKLQQALANTRLYGIATNLDYVRQIIASSAFDLAQISTRFLESFDYQTRQIEVLEAGTYTSVQDTGRFGYWDIGVPPSGAMDDYAFRLANRIVGNHPSAAGIEATIQGPTLRFHGDAIIALTGGQTPATLDGQPVNFWTPLSVCSGQVLKVGRVSSGCRTYIAVRQGLDVPDYLGSKSTFALGQFGGHAGRTLRVGDMLAMNTSQLATTNTPQPIAEPAPAPTALIPTYGQEWHIGVLYGPHGASDFFTPEFVDQFFAEPWQVHYNSNRLGVRLVGAKPTWARVDGGEAGLHPSNIHDCEYAIGSINFTGDTPVILTCDGPSLGGFVCLATIVKAELWKVGQVKPGDKIYFKALSFDQALALEQQQDEAIAALAAPVVSETTTSLWRNISQYLAHLFSPKEPVLNATASCVVAELAAQADRPAVCYRQAGDKYILLEYGQNVLDLRLRFRIHALMEALKAHPIAGIHELAPGVRSLQIRYDSRVVHQRALIEQLLALEERLPAVDQMTVPTRVVYLPLAFEDSATLDAVTRYRETVKAEAPWLPNNVDFIQRINGLDSREQVEKIVYEASYMVLGLGDVYLGAPCAVPVDPRHRLMTSKYNPARTFTAEGTVGIGGVYMCIYGMDSPGGYQLVGRTLPIWNKFLKNTQFDFGTPWLLRFFDQVRFYPVTEAELTAFRDNFREGKAQIRIEQELFALADYEQFLVTHADSITEFKAKQAVAYQQEVALWQNETTSSTSQTTELIAEVLDDDNIQRVCADISGSVWKVLVNVGDSVAAGQPLVILEAMKMEFPIYASVSGTVKSLHCRPSSAIAAGDALLDIETDVA
ncbi:urea carboxylase [Agitococcus lubricus]|uniref:Biotin carboxylase n=1 Tax=Agitococcus lubricus TaxID=1077255 RepID=A0A2T5IYA2_9GAMM|nr:urea carboxylase [Agitococcus lubricus]PTQ88960.1 urea carboxylase [Agitococcus lubricus]